MSKSTGKLEGTSWVIETETWKGHSIGDEKETPLGTESVTCMGKNREPKHQPRTCGDLDEMTWELEW